MTAGTRLLGVGPASLLAHGNGADEVALVAVPVVLFVAFLLWERRHHARRRAEDDDPT